MTQEAEELSGKVSCSIADCPSPHVDTEPHFIPHSSVSECVGQSTIKPSLGVFLVGFCTTGQIVLKCGRKKLQSIIMGQCVVCGSDRDEGWCLNMVGLAVSLLTFPIP